MDGPLSAFLERGCQWTRPRSTSFEAARRLRLVDLTERRRRQRRADGYSQRYIEHNLGFEFNIVGHSESARVFEF